MLYYTPPDSDIHRRINLSKAGTRELATLYAACEPAEFGLNRETVFNAIYRKTKKIDLDSFSPLFNPHRIGIFEQASRALLTGRRGTGIIDMELYKLNVHGQGDLSNSHKDTPRSESMVGSLVIVFPTQHEGGQLVLRQGMQEWTLDFADKFSVTTDPMVCFVAFFGDVEHEVLPITSGYGVTLTYNLYEDKCGYPNISYIPTPFHSRLKGALVELIDDKSVLQEGGYLGCGLVHEYVYDEDQMVNKLLGHLKGVDQILATICEEQGLRYSLRLLYRNLCRAGLFLVRECEIRFFEEALDDLTIHNVEGVELVGCPFSCDILDDDYQEGLDLFQSFYRIPVTKILEIRPVSSVNVATTYARCDKELRGVRKYMSLKSIHGQVSMLIALDPVASRKKLVL